MKELHERERANHAQNLLDSVQNTNKQLELRNKELELMITNTSKTSMELQQMEQQLRRELASLLKIN